MSTSTSTTRKPGTTSQMSLLEAANLPAELASMTRRLIDEYGPRVPEDVITDYVAEAIITFNRARLHHFVPLLVERSVRTKVTAWLADVTYPAGR